MSHQFKKCLVWSLFIVNVLFPEQHKMSQRAELLAIVEKEDAEAVVQFLKNVSKSRTGSFSSSEITVKNGEETACMSLYWLK